MTPIKPIGVSPLEGPLVEARFNFKWCAVIVGSLSQLLLKSTWDVATQAELTAIQEDVFDLMAQFCVNPPTAGVTPNTGAEGGDDFMLRQNPDNPCELQTSVDGVNWCTWADLSKCLPQVGQQADGSPQPAPGGGCQTYHVILPANGEYLLPAPVNPGDTLEITNLKGASNDGTLAPWYCGDGNLYFAGGCFGSSTTQPSDPVNTSPHLSLIAKAGGLAFPVLGGIISIGAVGAFQNLTFQVNDSILSDNMGSLEFDAKICNNEVGTWCREFDFRTGSFFTIGNPGACGTPFGTWSAGVGLIPEDHDDGSGNWRRELCLAMPISPGVNITDWDVLFDYTPGTFDGSPDSAQQVLANSTSLVDNLSGSTVNGTDVHLAGHNVISTVTDITFQFTTSHRNSAVFDGSCAIKKLTLRGTGTPPTFGGSC